MGNSIRHGGKRSILGRRVALLSLGVALGIFFVALKVERDNLSRSLERTHACIDRLQAERARLRGRIVFKQKPGVIEQIARGRLGMVYSSGRLSDLTFASTRCGMAQ